MIGSNPHDFQRQLSIRLLIWSALSISAGAVLAAAAVGFWHGFGIQALVWGLVDAAIGAFSLYSARRADHSPAGQRRNSQKLARLLWLNTGLDLLYLLGGLILLLTMGSREAAWAGHAWGILVQGGFLFFFDWQHALRVPPGPPPENLSVFSGEEHAAFVLPGGKAAAVVVHGFPGTPNEIRPLAEALGRAGWTVHALLLPGFGAQLSQLEQRTNQEWVETVSCALRELRQAHSPLLLVGFSMGGAVSIQAVARCFDDPDLSSPDGLVLLAPFTWRETLPQRALLAALPYLFPARLRPFRWRFLANPKTRQVMNALMRQADLEDPATRLALQEWSFPVAVVHQVLRAGAEAAERLPALDLPVLVIQGSQDRTVWPWHTRRAVRRLPRRPRFLEVQAGHDLFDTRLPAWDELEQAVLDFAHEVEEQAGAAEAQVSGGLRRM